MQQPPGIIRRPNRQKYTNEYIDQRLTDRGIIRLGESLGVNSKIDWQCTRCNYTWHTSVNNVIRCNTGCSRCSSLTDTVIDQRLGDRPIKRNHPRSKTAYMEWACKDCGFVWSATLDNVLNRNTGCKPCLYNKKRLDPLLIYDVLKAKHITSNLEELQSPGGTNKKITFTCDQCNHTWRTYVANPYYHDSGCPKCSAKSYSKAAMDWLTEQQKLTDYKILHAMNGGEQTVHGFRLDGYVPETDTAYEFYGKYWHGVPSKSKSYSDMHGHINMSYQEIYDKTLQRIAKMQSIFTNVIYVWES